MRPQVDATGLITGYSDNGTGIKSYGLEAGQPKTPSTKLKPQKNAAGQWVDTSTGLPYHGAYTDESGRQQFYSNGNQVNSLADVGIQNQAFSVSKTPKNPAISSAIDILQTQAGQAGGILSKSVNDYLAEAGRVNADAKTQLQKDQASYDTTQTENRLNRDVNNQVSDLNNINRNYATDQNRIQGDVARDTRDYTTGEQSRLASLDSRTAATDAAVRAQNDAYTTNQRGVQGDIATENKTYADTVAGRLAKLRDDLNTQNAQYETAAQSVADRSYAAAKRGNDLYHLTSGTPTSGSGALDNRMLRNYNDINIPLQQQLADRRYNQVNQLDSAQALADNQNYQNLMSQYAGASATNADFANRGMSIEQYLNSLYGNNYNAAESSGRNVYGANLAMDSGASALASDLAGRASDTSRYLSTTDANTAAQIQALRTQTAGMSRAAAASYLQQLAVPAAVAQQILSGQIANQSQIQSLDERANAYTFNSPYDASRVPNSPGYSVPVPRSYSPTRSTGNSGLDTATARTYSDTGSSGQVGSTAANGWILGSDGNYYVADASAPHGYRLVWQKPKTLTGAYSNAPANNYPDYADQSGSGYITGGPDTASIYSGFQPVNASTYQ